MNTTALIAANAARWAKAKITRGLEFTAVAKRLVAPAAKAIYQRIEARTGVPWFIVAVIHEREASQNFKSNIAQGDPWNAVSRHVPAGRGPFKSFEDAAYDALVNCAPHAGKWKDWSAGGALTILEQYNGLGSAMGPTGWAGKPYTEARKQKFPPLPSAYIWSGTDQYNGGKYVADHVFDRNVVDSQLGCAGLLLAMAQLDSSVKFSGEPVAKPAAPAPITPAPKPAPAKPVEAPKAPAPQPVAPVKTSWFSALLNGLAAAFKRKPDRVS